MEEENQRAQEDEVAVLESIYADDLKRLGAKEFQVTVRPQLAGMASGDEGDALPPVVLRFTLHGRYPSDDPPAFSVSSAWMRREDEENVKRAMTALFEEQKGSVILFSWVEWLRENLLATIGWTESDYVAHATSAPASAASHSRDYAGDAAGSAYESSVDWIRGDPVTDRKSKFVAHLVHVDSVDEVDVAMTDLLRDKKVANATHNIAAYRIVEPDGRLVAFRDDDGETGAGDKLLYMLERMDMKNTLVVVTRWYGGIQLGPDRFKHITGCAKQLIEQVGLGSSAESEGGEPPGSKHGGKKGGKGKK